MATGFAQLPVTCSHVFKPQPIPTQMMKLLRPTHRKPISFGYHTSAKAADKDVITEAEIRNSESIAQTKQALFAALQGINRGIFGVPSEKKTEIDKLVGILESQNPTPEPTLCPEKLGGAWKLIYGTVVILGSKRTKLGLRDFITLGDLFQYIDVTKLM